VFMHALSMIKKHQFKPFGWSFSVALLQAFGTVFTWAVESHVDRHGICVSAGLGFKRSQSI